MCPNRNADNRIETNFVIDEFFVGEDTFFVRSSVGEMYASGINQNSQLCIDKSLNNGNYITSLTKIQMNNVDTIAQGKYHTLFKSGSTVTGCGNNYENQMGPSRGEYSSPTYLFEDENLSAIAACAEGSIFVVKNKVHVIGTQLYGELGMDENDITAV